MLKEKISKVELQMKAALSEVRETFEHSGNKGTSTEDIFGKFVRQYLPRRLDIGNGEIIDSFGNRSGQVDIVILSDDHPFTFPPGRPGLFFIEGVLSVGEIKTTLTSQELNNALNNSTRYKKLKMTHENGTLANANPSDLNRYYEHPPFFLFAYESQLSLSTIKTKIQNYQVDNKLNLTDSLDAVFILDKGWVVNFGDGQGSFQYRTTDGKVHGGLIEKETNEVLFSLFSYLSMTMPREIRFRPILTKYLFSPDGVIK
jgi:hypothetical protein